MQNIRFFSKKSDFDANKNSLTDATNPHIAYTSENDQAFVTALEDVIYESCSVSLTYTSANGKIGLFHASGETIIPIVSYRFDRAYSNGRHDTYTGSTSNPLNGVQILFGGSSVNTTSGAVKVDSKGTTVSNKKTYVTTANVQVSFSGIVGTAEAVLYQAPNVLSSWWSAPTGLSLSAPMIPASGGTISSCTVNGTITQVLNHDYTSNSVSSTTYTYNQSEIESSSWSSAVVGANLKSSVTTDKKIGTLSYTYTINGKSTTCSIDIKQEANYEIETLRVYGQPYGLSIDSVSYIPASGGSISSSTVNGTVSRVNTLTYKSGTVIDVKESNITFDYSHGSFNTVTASSLGKTVTTQPTFIDDLVYTYSLNGKSNSATTPVYQEINEKRKVNTSGGEITYKSVNVTNCSIKFSPYSDSYIPASGGTITSITANDATQTVITGAVYTSYVYTSKEEETVKTAEQQEDIKYIPAKLSVTSVSASTMGTTEYKTGKTITTVTATYNGSGSLSNSIDKTVYQSPNIIENSTQTDGEFVYGDYTLGTISEKTIPASGGSATSSASTGSQSYTTTDGTIDHLWSSGEHSYETIKGGSGSVTLYPNPSSLTAKAGSKGQTVSDKTSVSSVTVNWCRSSVNGDVVTTSTMKVYQASNKLLQSYSTPDDNIVYGTPSITINSGLTAGDSQATVSYGCTDKHTMNYFKEYNSGTYYISANTVDVRSTVEIAMTSNGNGRFTYPTTYGSGDAYNTIKHTSMSGRDATDTVTLTARNANDRSKTSSKSVSVTNKLLNFWLEPSARSIGKDGDTIYVGGCGYFSANPNQVYWVPASAITFMADVGTFSNVTSGNPSDKESKKLYTIPANVGDVRTITISGVYQHGDSVVTGTCWVQQDASINSTVSIPLWYYPHDGYSGSSITCSTITTLQYIDNPQQFDNAYYDYEKGDYSVEQSLYNMVLNPWAYNHSTFPNMDFVTWGSTLVSGKTVSNSWLDGNAVIRFAMDNDLPNKMFNGVKVFSYDSLLTEHSTTYNRDTNKLICDIPVQEVASSYGNFLTALNNFNGGGCDAPLSFAFLMRNLEIPLIYTIYNNTTSEFTFSWSFSLTGDNTTLRVNMSESSQTIGPSDRLSGNCGTATFQTTRDTIQSLGGSRYVAANTQNEINTIQLSYQFLDLNNQGMYGFPANTLTPHLGSSGGWSASYNQALFLKNVGALYVTITFQ